MRGCRRVGKAFWLCYDNYVANKLICLSVTLWDSMWCNVNVTTSYLIFSSLQSCIERFDNNICALFFVHHRKVHLHCVKANAKAIFLWCLSLLNVNIKFDSLWTHLEAMSLSLSRQYKGTLTLRKTNSDLLLLNMQSKLTVFKVKIHCQYKRTLTQRTDKTVDYVFTVRNVVVAK